MKSKSFNLNRFLRLILPSIFFIVCIALYVYKSRPLAANLVAIGFALLLLGNIFLQNKIISRIFGIIFLFGSCFMLLALLDDIADGEATLAGGYWVGLVLCLSGLAMSALLIWGYKRKERYC